MSGSSAFSTPNPSRQGSTAPTMSEERRRITEAMMTPVVEQDTEDTPEGTGAAPDPDELPQLVNGAAWRTSSLRVTTERARKLAVERKLHPYQRDLVDRFLTLSPNSRQISSYINQFDILNKLDSMVTTSSSKFSVSSALMENIKSHVISVLLSPKLAAYRGTVPRDHVMSVLRREALNLPDNYERDTSVIKVISLAVSDELTQCRAKIKKDISASIQKKSTIYELAAILTRHTRCVVTPALCARLSLLRTIYIVDPGQNTYWTTVDNKLVNVRELSGGNAVKLTRYFKSRLDEDRALYGGSDADQPSYTPLAATWQESIDDIVDSQ